MKTSKREQIRAAGLAGAALSVEKRGKQVEIDALELMLDWLGWSGVALDATERPDFFFSLEMEGRVVRVGCELTNLYTVLPEDRTGVGSAEARFWRQWRSFAREIQVALESESPTLGKTYGAIHFRNPDYEVLDRVDKRQLIGEIVRLLNEPRPNPLLDTFPADKFPQLSEHVDHIWTADVTDECPLWWAAHLRSGILKNPSQAIVRAINEKSAKAKSYRWLDSQLRWLIIVAPGRGIRDNVPWYYGESYSSSGTEIPFSHVFLFARGIGGWYVLQLHPTIAPIPYRSKLLLPANGG
jgi:hypothetical protein